MHALVEMGHPDPAELDHGRVERGTVGVDEPDPTEEQLQHVLEALREVDYEA